MSRLNPEKLSVEFRPPVTPTAPIIPRRYTLTHSDITAELFLTIGPEFAYDKVNQMRDEVLAEWRLHNGYYFLYVYVFIGNYGPVSNSIRDTIFRRELPLALEAIVYGDSRFYRAYPQLLQAPIYVYFDSTDLNYRSYEYWGTPIDYR